MKIFLETFKKSVYDPVFYRSVAEGTMKEAVVFYVKASLFLATIMVIFFAIVLIPQGIGFVSDRAPALVKEYYPENLIVKMENGEASVNVPEPFIIANKIETPLSFVDGKPVENLLVIDTTDDFEKAKFERYNSFALLTKHELVTKGGQGSITIQNLSSFPSAVINQETLLSWISKINNSLAFFVPIGILLTLFALFLGFMAYLLPLILFALIPFLVAWLKKIPMTYGGAYKISLYAVVPALALKTIFNISGVIFIPAYFTLLIFILIVSLNVREVEQPKLFDK